MKDNSSNISWTAPEYVYRHKSPDWYWGAGLIALVLIVVSIFQKNFLLTVFIFIGTFILMIYGARKPQIINLEINRKGIIVEDTLYPFSELKSFWIEETDEEAKIIIESQKKFMPYLAVPLGDLSEDQIDIIRETLLGELDEEFHTEPISQKLLDYLGF